MTILATEPSVERIAVRVVLINKIQQVLLMQVHLPGAHRVDGSPHNELYWITVGGKSEVGESVQETAMREVKEETGLKNITIDRVLGYETFDLIVQNNLTRYYNTYVLAYVADTYFSSQSWTEKEKGYVKKMKWFSLEDVKSYEKDIHPINPLLAEIYLPIFLKGQIPEAPIQLNKTQ